MKKLVSTSVLSADFSKMGNEVERMCNAGADWMHYDVMDGMFVTNITFGFKMISDSKKYCSVPCDVHLMIVKPERYLERFIEAGADLLTFHIEATEDAVRDLTFIREKGVKAGLAINPETPIESVFPYLKYCDLIIVMGVHPGYGAQGYIPETTGRISQLKKEILRQKVGTMIEIDGGVNAENYGMIYNAGADVLVTGSAVFKSPDPRKFISLLKS